MNQIICFLVFVLLSFWFYIIENNQIFTTHPSCDSENSCEVVPKIIDGNPVIELKFELSDTDMNSLKELRLIFLILIQMLILIHLKFLKLFLLKRENYRN